MKLSFIAVLAALVISVAGCESRTATDAAVTTAVKNRLATDPATSGARINVDTANGVVTLSGSVSTAAEKAEAERIARNTQGVTQVVNNINVEPGAATPEMTMTPTPEMTVTPAPGTTVTPAPGTTATPGRETGASRAISDAAILSNVKSRLLASGIIGTNVDVKNGEVTIKGAVANEQEKTRAEEIARQASGVKRVNNQLTIKQR
ncbi:MAG TPA: BON domain-containing protein [Blastocatellia bacterium]